MKKTEFMARAKAQGLALCAAAGITLEKAIETIDKGIASGYTPPERVKCEIKSAKHLVRGTSHLHLEATDKVYQHRGYIIIHSVYPETPGMPENHHCVIYY